MTGKVRNKTGAVLIAIWGALNLVGGALGAADHPSAFVLPLFVFIGSLVFISGIGFWLGKRWAGLAAAIGLLGLSLTALYSASVLRGWSGLHVSHHLLRLFISAILFVLAFWGRQKERV